MSWARRASTASRAWASTALLSAVCPGYNPESSIEIATNATRTMQSTPFCDKKLMCTRTHTTQTHSHTHTLSDTHTWHSVSLMHTYTPTTNTDSYASLFRHRGKQPLTRALLSALIDGVLPSSSSSSSSAQQAEKKVSFL